MGLGCSVAIGVVAPYQNQKEPLAAASRRVNRREIAGLVGIADTPKFYEASLG
jgi:hypothetical protein